MIEFVTSTAYSLVEASWHSASFVIKFYLLFALARVYQQGHIQDDIKWQKIDEHLTQESEKVLALIVGLGVLKLVIGYNLRPRFEVISELTALVYLGYLFWKF